MKLIPLLLFFFIITPPATASSGIFDIFNETEYKGSLDIVTEYPDPVKTTQSHKHIRGWVYPVGFTQVVRINGTEYFNQSTPIIKYDVWDSGLYWNDNLDWIKIDDERYYFTANTTTVEIDIHLLWHHSSKRCRTVNGHTSCWIHKDYYHEYATFSTTVESPIQYPAIYDSEINITVYDNTFNPHIDIHNPVQPFETKTVVKYQNETITRYTKSGFASVGAVNLSDCLYWEDESDNFKYRNEMVIIDNLELSNFNPTCLEITTHSPYDSVSQSNYSISIVQFDESGGLTPPVFIYMAILLIFAIGAKKCFSAIGDMI